MTDEQLICWAAGFFDGEGCVNVSVTSRHLVRDNGKEVDRTYYGIHGIICQRERAPLDLLHKRFGGHLFPYEIRGNMYYRWHVWADGAKAFFEAILPFSVLKQARLALAVECQTFKNEQNTARRIGGACYRYSDAVNRKIESFYLQMKDLNRKYVNPENPEPKPSGAKRGGRDYFRRTPEIQPKGDSGSVQ